MEENVTGTTSTAWKTIWKLKIPPNVKNFLWRCLHGVLPTLSVLASRHVEVDTICPLCHLYDESLRHLMCDCTHVAALWQSLPNCLMPIGDEDFGDWLAGTLMGDEIVMIQCAARLWCIWCERNCVVWSQKNWNAAAASMEALRILESWQPLTGNRLSASALNSAARTHAVVPDDAFTLLVDAAVFPNDGLASYGVVLKDSDGNYVAVKNGPIRCVQDAHLAEAIAIKEALSWAYERRLSNVVVLSDCQTACKFFNGSLLDFSSAGCVIQQCRVLR
ncbi:PREDICTED: uncharacterized protein LOC109164040 [Ipomoea nil]|uniref:uncharacterized protein LOC109164040 n=1 Tax=Ipomoea nil TaxID=35883 RepID=UPI0009017942|nr:PREDICTED: uncharacterized protein LOC109164040 [Ipomoea nil]